MEQMNTEKQDTTVKNGANITVFKITVLIVIVSFAAGIGGAWLFTQRLAKKIVVVDVEKIINKRKEEFTQKYGHRDIGEATTKTEMSRDIGEFAEKMERVLSEQSNDKIILNKGSVVSNLDDITESVMTQIWER
jgi:hypothetical protein